jgi:hypothetical protein
MGKNILFSVGKKVVFFCFNPIMLNKIIFKLTASRKKKFFDLMDVSKSFPQLKWTISQRY